MMTPIAVLFTVTAYFIVLLIVSGIARRNVDNAGFFTGNRQSKWYMVAFAMIGASISGVTYVSVPGMVDKSGFGYLQLVMGFIVGQLVIAFVLTPLFYKMQLTSVYEYLRNRFGMASYHTGAWFFFVSKMLGAAVRLFLVCFTLQLLAFEPLGIPFIINVGISVGFVWLYTHQVLLCIVFIARDMHLSFTGVVNSIQQSEMSRIFFFDDVNNKQFFFKQFFAGIFTTIAMTGLDQDMMQRNLSCRNSRESQKNMLISILMQFIVVAAFLMLGVLLYQEATLHGMDVAGDQLFPTIATSRLLPGIVGILFIIGLASSAYNAAGSALTALTTSFTVDILGIKNRSEEEVKRTRKLVHIGMTVLMGAVIVAFNALNNTSVIDAVYTLASYTYGPILGMFTFGILLKKPVRDKWIPLVALASPLLCLLLDKHSEQWFNGYRFSYELLILNALFTFIGLCLLIRREQTE